jgi:uncharacterized protein (TIGR02594 family)
MSEPELLSRHAAPPIVSITPAHDIDPPWLAVARSYIGTHEIPGPKHSPVISRWLHGLKAWWADDETPWCGTFVAACLQQAGQPVERHWMRARAWLDWGLPIEVGALGAVAVLKRGSNPTEGHVGFVVGWDAGGRLLLLGGNQGNEVNVSAFAPDRLLGYRWPLAVPTPTVPAPYLTRVAQLSANEA